MNNTVTNKEAMTMPRILTIKYKELKIKNNI